MKTEFNLHFGGFYHSEHSERIDCMAEALSIEDVNFAETNEEYIKCYINAMNGALDINVEYIALDSPRFYNFETDTARVIISPKDRALIVDGYSADAKEYINEASSSRDGFFSFYDGYEEVIKDKSIFMEYLFKYILQDIDFLIMSF